MLELIEGKSNALLISLVCKYSPKIQNLGIWLSLLFILAHTNVDSDRTVACLRIFTCICDTCFVVFLSLLQCEHYWYLLVWLLCSRILSSAGIVLVVYWIMSCACEDMSIKIGTDIWEETCLFEKVIPSCNSDWRSYIQFICLQKALLDDVWVRYYCKNIFKLLSEEKQAADLFLQAILCFVFSGQQFRP